MSNERLMPAPKAQPIRDAPKDGTPILLWTKGRWIEGRWDEYANDPWSDSDEGYWKLRYAEVDFYSVTPERQPTHWLPVPADPTKPVGPGSKVDSVYVTDICCPKCGIEFDEMPRREHTGEVIVTVSCHGETWRVSNKRGKLS